MNLSEYKLAAWTVRERHISRDEELVSSSAEKHGVGISVGSFFDSPDWGAYNIRLPKGDEWEFSRLNSVRGIAKLCIDYRQSANVISYAESRGLVAWADAGGAAQPDRSILRADMEYWDAALTINANIVAWLFAHLGVCGGANHYSGGRMAELDQRRERGAMTEYVYAYAKELRKVKPDLTIKQGLVLLNDHGKYDKIVNI